MAPDAEGLFFFYHRGTNILAGIVAFLNKTTSCMVDCDISVSGVYEHLYIINTHFVMHYKQNDIYRKKKIRKKFQIQYTITFTLTQL